MKRVPRRNFACAMSNRCDLSNQLTEKVVRAITYFTFILVIAFSNFTVAEDIRYYVIEGKEQVDAYKHLELATVAYSNLLKTGDAYGGAFGHKYRILEVKSGNEGFRAVSFIDESTKKIIIAFVGTNDLSDALADIELTQETLLNSVMKPEVVNQFLKLRTVHPDSVLSGQLKLTKYTTSVLDSQINQAFLFFDKTLKSHADMDVSRISVTGHSWGGFLSQMNAAKYGIVGHTMSAPGVPKSILHRYGITIKPSIKIKNHGRTSDPVFNFGEHIGETITYPEADAKTFNSRLLETGLPKNPILIVKEHSSDKFVENFASGQRGMNVTSNEEKNGDEKSAVKGKLTTKETKENAKDTAPTKKNDFNLLVVEPKTGKVLYEIIDKSNSSSILVKSEINDDDKSEGTTEEGKKKEQVRSANRSGQEYWIDHEGSMLNITLSKILELMKCNDDESCQEKLYAEIQKIVDGCKEIEDFEDCPKGPDIGLVAEQEITLDSIDASMSVGVITVDLDPNVTLDDREAQTKALRLQDREIRNWFFEKNSRSDRLNTSSVESYLENKAPEIPYIEQ